MLRRLDLRSAPLPGPARLRGLLPRAEVDVDAVLEQVRPIVDAVRERGDAALAEYARRLDGAASVERVPSHELDAAVAVLRPDLRRGLEVGMANIAAVAGASLGDDAERSRPALAASGAASRAAGGRAGVRAASTPRRRRASRRRGRRRCRRGRRPGGRG